MCHYTFRAVKRRRRARLSGFGEWQERYGYVLHLRSRGNSEFKKIGGIAIVTCCGRHDITVWAILAELRQREEGIVAGLLETVVLATTMISMSALVALVTRDYAKAKRKASAEYRRARTLATAFVSELDKRLAAAHESHHALTGEVEEIRRSLDTFEDQIGSVHSGMALKADSEDVESRVRATGERIRALEESLSRLRTVMSVQRIQAFSPSVSEPFLPRFSRLNATERRILEILKDGTKNYREIQDSTGLSREHVSRELKRLFDLGFVERDEGVRPYQYKSLVQVDQETN
ncbi:MAG: helix-turn-helix transcriptional regulator [Candidatus Geothermarchaeales archaeon]